MCVGRVSIIDTLVDSAMAHELRVRVCEVRYMHNLNYAQYAIYKYMCIHIIYYSYEKSFTLIIMQYKLN